MAVVQISKIQLRRGKKSTGTGLPQLSSGEMGWAIDSQELYIGNGSVSEGSPAVGNTKILTEKDDLFKIAKDYTYKEGTGSVVTGTDALNPVVRSLQQRLDDRVSGRSFGLSGDSTQDATVRLQRAIDQLYLNGGMEATVANRVELHLEAGTYIISDTIRIPPHATILGAGSDKTKIIQNTAAKSVFTCVSDESISGVYVLDGTYASQARNIMLKGMTLQTAVASKGLVLQSCRDSYFQDLTILGPWTASDAIPTDSSTTTSIGLSLNSKNGGVESVRNEFTNCHVQGWAYGVVSNWDINDNVFTTCNFGALGYGVAFGKNMTIDGSEANGTAFGPKNNIFSDCVFTSTSREAMLMTHGTYNVSRNNKYITCGNNGGSDDMPITAILSFAELGNDSIGDYFTRTKVLSYTQGTILTKTATLTAGQVLVTVADTTGIIPGQLCTVDTGTGEFGTSRVTVVSVDSLTQFSVDVPHLTSGSIGFSILSAIITSIPYIPEVEGPCNFEWGFEHSVSITAGLNQTIFRLPKLANQCFDIDYMSIGTSQYNGVRSGTLSVLVSAINDSGNGTPAVIVTDEYSMLGNNNVVDNISFDAIISDIDGDSTSDTILIKSNTAGIISSTATTKFKFRVKTKQIAL